MVGPELLETLRSDFGSTLLPHFSMTAVAALAVYALCAMMLASGTLIGGAYRSGSPSRAHRQGPETDPERLDDGLRLYNWPPSTVAGHRARSAAWSE